MKTGEISNGFKFKVDEEVLDDMELVEDLAAVDTDALVIPKILNRILGEEQKKQLYEHVRNEKGRVPMSEVADCITEIITKIGEKGKN